MYIPKWLLWRLIRKWPIYSQIEMFREWRGHRFPDAARNQSDELLRFVFRTRIRSVNDILLEDISAYRDSYSSTHYRNVAYKSFKQFFLFCKKMGYANIQIEQEGEMIRMEKIHPLLDLENVLRVKQLRKRKIDGKPMSYRAIKAYLEKVDKKIYDVHSIYRWDKYQLPQGMEPA